ncbi:MAG: alpha/beta hydrolase family protein [Pirellulales bacterium]
MHRFRFTVVWITIFACYFILACSTASRAAEVASAAGHWEGEISLPGTKLAIRVDLEQADAAWTGTIDIPVQGLRGFKLAPVTVEGTKVGFLLPNIPGEPAFAGQLDKKGETISGDFTQAGQKFPFSLARKERKNDPGQTPSKGIPGTGLAGFWQGSLKPSPVIELRLALEIKAKEGPELEGDLISLDQGSARIPLRAKVDEAGVVKILVASIGGAFEGKFSGDGSEMTGEWRQGGQKFPLAFKRVAEAVKLHRPQEPQPPFPYDEEQVSIENQAAGVTLAGTLTLPKGAGPHPAMVLVTGSGPQDRDEAIMGHRPFFVLADHLTRQGIAVLRFDDRGVGKSTGNFGTATHNDFVGDALSAVEWLKARKEIDPQRIGIIGHSEGGIVAPLAAAKQPGDIAFIVLLAGVGVPMDELLVRQGMDLGSVMGGSEVKLIESAAKQRELYGRIIKATDAAEVEKLVRELVTQQLAEFTPEQREAMGLTEGVIESQIKTASTPWFRQLVAYNPRPALEQVKCPVLAINGEKDLQVAADDNLTAIQKALAAGGNTQVKIVKLEGLNHLFQHCTTGAISEYGQIEETMSPEVLELVSGWIRERTRLTSSNSPAK